MTDRAKPLSVSRRLKIEGPFTPLKLELLQSKAWRSMSINMRRVIDLLMTEHMLHGGWQNGQLITTYDQMQDHGIGRAYIADAISGLEDRGLIAIVDLGRKALNE